MLKRIDKMQSIMTEKVLGTEILSSSELDHYSVLFGLEVKQNKMAENLERGWSYYKGIIASIPFNTVEEAQDYANKIMNTNLDYNDYKKHKEKEGK